MVIIIAAFAFAAAVCAVIWAFYGPPWSGEVEAAEPTEPADEIVDFKDYAILIDAWLDVVLWP